MNLRVSIAATAAMAAALLFSGIASSADPANNAVVTSIKGEPIELAFPASAPASRFPRAVLRKSIRPGTQSNPRYFNFADWAAGG
jgi:hypothetical protein